MAQEDSSMTKLGGGRFLRSSPLIYLSKIKMNFFQIQYKEALITRIEHTFGICSLSHIVVYFVRSRVYEVLKSDLRLTALFGGQRRAKL